MPDDGQTALAASISNTSLRYGERNGDEALIDAIIALRRTKSPAEIGELQRAAEITARAFAATMRATHPGGSERGLWAVFEAALQLGGCTTGYDTILTQSGEILHNHDHSQPLASGRWSCSTAAASARRATAST